jgi:hypothetical protein
MHVDQYLMKIEDHPLVSFLPLDLTNPDSLESVVSHIDYTMQYGEDEEPKEVCLCRMGHRSPQPRVICVIFMLTIDGHSRTTWIRETLPIWNESFLFSESSGSSPSKSPQSAENAMTRSVGVMCIQKLGRYSNLSIKLVEAAQVRHQFEDAGEMKVCAKQILVSR